MARSLNSSRSSLELKKKYLKEDEALAVAVDFDDPNIDKGNAIIGALEDDSPYPEVRSAVANTDDPTILVSTLRVWVLGLALTVLLSGVDQFFYFRYPSVSVGVYVAVLVSLPLGRAWAAVVPKWSIFGIPLNPGPFSIKEHVLLTIMANVGAESAYAMEIIAVQRVFYNQTYSFTYQWMLVMSTQLLGFSLGGIVQRFLIHPPSMIWPANLVTCVLFNTLHARSYAGMGTRGGISRGRFFLYAWAASVCWYIVPGYLFQGLSYFSWVCWIAPESVVVNQLFGYVHGLGMSVITFDWAQISYTGSPLATPWWVQINIICSFMFFIWILTPILYYTNTWHSAYLPISSSRSFDNTGSPYNLSRIINSDTSFNLTAYKQYSPVFLSTTFALIYGTQFASITATLVHTLLYFRKQIWAQTRHSMSEQPDVHACLMSKYKQVPAWWYSIIFASMFVFGIVVIEVWHTQFPLWAFCVCLAIPLVCVIPIGMIQAMTNQQVGLNLISELIAGYILPGRPVAVMMFKTWAYISMCQALTMSSDFKLGHYMKIPPRPMFWAQVIGTVVAGTVQLVVQAWMFANIPDICNPDQKNGFTCQPTEVFGTSSIIWGVIGPQRMFSPGAIYHLLVYWLPIGAIFPVIVHMIQLKWPNSFIRHVSVPVIFTGLENIPPATALNYVTWAVVGFIFNYCIRRKHSSWWIKYNYVLSAALDSGVALSVVLIFFLLQYPRNGTIGLNNVQTWWGNTVFSNTADGKGLPYKPLPPSGTFGPSTW